MVREHGKEEMRHRGYDGTNRVVGLSWVASAHNREAQERINILNYTQLRGKTGLKKINNKVCYKRTDANCLSNKRLFLFTIQLVSVVYQYFIYISNNNIYIILILYI